VVDQAQPSTNLQDILEVIIEAKIKYEGGRKATKARYWLDAACKRPKHYESVMNVLVQHNPEYVALAWGAMKALFMAFLNHEGTVATLAQAISEIGDTLPQLELAAMLHPTLRMKKAVADLYGHIIHFFIVAHEWYGEGRWKHALHSITHPPELRYKDLLDHISECSESIRRLSMVGTQAEQRDMHAKLDIAIKRLDCEGFQVSKLLFRSLSLTTFLVLQAITSGGFINADQILTDLQFSQIMSILSNTPVEDPIKTYQQGLVMRARRARRLRTRQIDPFWLSPKLQTWSASAESALSFLKGTFHSRFEVKDACI
jgi:hypothetical protein